MPKLTYFVACEKILHEEEKNNVSLISLFDTIDAIKPNEDMVDTQIALKWEIVANWVREEGTEGKTYQQKTHLLAPDGKTYAETVIEFTVPKHSHRNTVHVFGFPVSLQGTYFLKLFLKQVADEEWVEIAEYPINVKHIDPAQKKE